MCKGYYFVQRLLFCFCYSDIVYLLCESVQLFNFNFFVNYFFCFLGYWNVCFFYTVKKIYCIFTGSKSTERTVIFLPLQIVNFFTEIFSESVYSC